jgi:lysine decarboxylase
MLAKTGCYAWDSTKLAINVRKLGLSGFDVETILRREYGIQVELADLYNVLFLFSIGDNQETVSRLLAAMEAIAAGQKLKNITKIGTHLPETSELVVTPQVAFYSDTKIVKLEEAEGEIAAEMIMAYPPGIPILCPGERITTEIIEYVRVLKQENCQLQGTEDPYMEQIKVLTRHFVVVQPNNVAETAG